MSVLFFGNVIGLYTYFIPWICSSGSHFQVLLTWKSSGKKCHFCFLGNMIGLYTYFSPWVWFIHLVCTFRRCLPQNCRRKKCHFCFLAILTVCIMLFLFVDNIIGLYKNVIFCFFDNIIGLYTYVIPWICPSCSHFQVLLTWKSSGKKCRFCFFDNIMDCIPTLAQEVVHLVYTFSLTPLEPSNPLPH